MPQAGAANAQKPCGGGVIANLWDVVLLFRRYCVAGAHQELSDVLAVALQMAFPVATEDPNLSQRHNLRHISHTYKRIGESSKDACLSTR
jgi:hypothetical protein